MCLPRWPSGSPGAGNADGPAKRRTGPSDIARVQRHGCVVIVPATTAPRARSLAAACLALAALSLAARCYASSAARPHPHPLAKRQAPTDLHLAGNATNATALNSPRSSTSRPMPSVPGSLHEPHDKHPTDTVSGDASQHPELVDRSGGGGGGGGLLALVVGATLLTATLGLITCVVSHYRGGGGGGGGGSAGGAPPPPPPPPPPLHDPSPHHHHLHHPYITAAPMLSVMSASAAAGVGVAAAAAGDGARLHRHVGHVGVSRELAAQRDRQVRLHSVHTDLELDLPPSIALPDGEELPYGSSARLHIRDPEQESEIYQKCIRAPPNRTVFESESPPPYRSSSAGLLGSLGSSSSSGTSDWSAGSTPLVVRCHSMSSSAKPHAHHPSSQKTDFLQRTVKILTGRKSSSSSSGSQPPAPAPTLPVVVVPVRPRRLDPRSPHV